MKNEISKTDQTDKLFTLMMTILNLSIVSLIGVAVWFAFSLLDQSSAIAELINGSFLY